MLERTTVANELAARIRQQLADIKARTSTFPKRRVLYVLNSEPLMTVGEGSFIHHMIEAAGGANVAAHSSVPYPRLSMEEVLKQDPEILLFPVGKIETVSGEEQRTWRRWTTISAVKQDRLTGIPTDLVNRPGPRVIEGLDALARAIHPEAYPPIPGH
jgi:iron complex transport system substrate-binding protein